MSQGPYQSRASSGVSSSPSSGDADSSRGDSELMGRTISGKYKIEKFLGGGAMGAVYKAYQKSIEKHVAIKVLHREFVREPSFVSRFEREAKAASLLDHGNLMRVIDYGREADGVCYIAMELLEGKSLYQLMKDGGRLGNERIASLIRQTLAGLAVAHEMGIIHRDLKPENIIVLEKSDDDGRRIELVKVCDFGMAKLVTPDQDGEAPLSSEKLTSHGVVVGTPDYMSPEQGKGERLDARSDLYAVGVILYQMLSGRLPFSAETPIATLLRHVIDEPVPPSEITENVHPGLESVCLRSLAKRREDRFQTAREMRAEIRVVLEGRGHSMTSALPPSRLELGSIPDAGFGAFDLKPPPVPRTLDMAPSRAQTLTPPQSHRIRAVEVLREERPPSRRWAVLLVVVAALAGGAFELSKHRRIHAVPKVATAPPVVVVTSHQLPGPEPPPPTASTTPGLEVAGEGKALALPTYATPTPASVAIRGVTKAEPVAIASVPPPSSSSPQAFGVLAVPEVPKIAGAIGGSSELGAAPSASTTPPPQDPFAHAHVSPGSVHADHVAAGDVLAALPVSRFERCYRKALASQGSTVAGQGSLRLSIDGAGHIGSASFAGPAELASVGQCVADATIGGDVKHVEEGVTGAEVDLVFTPQ